MNETKAKHTPGPWQLERMKGGWEVIPVDPRAMDGTIGLLNDHGDGEDRANARLIVAAPELLETLRRVTVLCTRYAAALSSVGPNPQEEMEILEGARAAIAKAEGPEA